MSTPIIDEAAKVFADPTSYADEPRLHAALTHLRAHAPVSLVDCPPYRPFWAITKHADIVEIERAHDLTDLLFGRGGHTDKNQIV